MFKKSNIPGDVTPKPATKEAAPTATVAAATAAPEAAKAVEPAAAEPAKDSHKA